MAIDDEKGQLENQDSCHIEEFDKLSGDLKSEVRRWVNVISEYLEYSQASSKRAEYKLRKDFVLRYRIGHPGEKRFSEETLRIKIRDYRNHGPLSLAPNWGKSKNYSEWPDEAKSFLTQKFLNINRPTISWCNEQLEIEALKKGWKLPSRTTRRRYLLKIPQETQDYYRKGRRYWLQNHIPSNLIDYEKMVPGEIYVLDHYQFNVAVRLPSGRTGFPWITPVMDRASRKILIFALSETPSSDSINHALMKTLKKYSVPLYLILDNGRDFCSLQFTGGLKRFRYRFNKDEIQGIYSILGIGIIFNIPGNAQAKPIERFFPILADFEKTFPTYRGNTITNRPEGVDDRIRDGKCVLEWDEFSSCLENYIDHYNQTHRHGGHGMNGRTPDEVWNNFFKDNPVRKVSPASLRLLMMKSARPVMVGRFGVTGFDNFYRSDPLMDRQGEKVCYRYDPEDLETIYIYDLKWAFICTAQKVRRSEWNDERAYHEIKALEKRRRKAIIEQRDAAERLVRIETGYQKYEVKEDSEPKAKIVRILRTPFDHVQKEIDEKIEMQDGGKGDESDSVIDLFRQRFSIKKDEEIKEENISKRSFMRLTISGGRDDE